jgi:hypothetical protein
MRPATHVRGSFRRPTLFLTPFLESLRIRTLGIGL